MTDLFINPASAVLSPCRTYRYELWRRWDDSKGSLMFIGLNPSTADETQDDPTVRRCITFAKAWGYGSLCMANLFAFRAKKPKDMLAASDPIGPDNNATIARLAGQASLTIAAWGTHGSHMDRDQRVIAMVPNLHCLKVNADGSPGHPLYLPANSQPRTYTP